MKFWLGLTLLLALFLQGCLGNYPTNVSTNTAPPKKLPQEIAEDSIRNYTKRAFAKIGKYKDVVFGELVVNKPDEIKVLDSLLLQRRKLPYEKDKYKHDLPNVIARNDSAITQQKKLIHDNKIYHTFSIEHIHEVITPDSVIHLYETEYLLLPDYTVKDIHISLSMILSPKENELFYYFIMKKPLYNFVDAEASYQMNEATYDQLYTLLDNEEENKEELLRTILIITDYIRQHNAFVVNDILQILTVNWMKKNLVVPNYKPLQFSTAQEIKSGDDLIGYKISHLFTIEDENKKIVEKAIYFEFDSNFIIKGAVEITPPFDAYFKN